MHGRFLEAAPEELAGRMGRGMLQFFAGMGLVQ
jgi:hypothetical protein